RLPVSSWYSGRAERRVPAADIRGQRGGFLRPPRPGGVLADRRPVVEDRLHDAPRGLDPVLAREERRIAGHRVDEEPLVRGELVGRRTTHEFQLGPLGYHLPALLLHAGTEGDGHVRAEAEAQRVPRVRREVQQGRTL